MNWILKGQNIVTMLSTEAEYIVLSDGAKEITNIANLLVDTDHLILPSNFSEDDAGAILPSGNKQVCGSTKHIDTSNHEICEKWQTGVLLSVMSTQ